MVFYVEVSLEDLSMFVLWIRELGWAPDWTIETLGAWISVPTFFSPSWCRKRTFWGRADVP